MKKLTASAAVLALATTASTATAGGLIQPVEEPMVAVPAGPAGTFGLSPAVAIAAGTVGVLAVGAIIANNDDDDDDNSDHHH